MTSWLEELQYVMLTVVVAAEDEEDAAVLAAALLLAALLPAELLAAELLAAALLAADDAEPAELDAGALVVPAALLGALVAAEVVPDPLLFELQAASAAPAATREPTWKKRRRVRRESVCDSSGWVMMVLSTSTSHCQQGESASATTEGKPRTP
jgi:hypothetical protein